MTSPSSPVAAAYRHHGSLPPLGEQFRSDHGNTAIVVTPDADPAEALADLLTDCYGGEWSPDSPGVRERAATLTVERWWSCRKALRYDLCGGDFDDYWSPDGDGARSVYVVNVDEDIHDLGDKLRDHASVAPTESPCQNEHESTGGR